MRIDIQNIQKTFKLNKFFIYMFSKKCDRCGKKINNNYEFCPCCGNKLNSEKEWGMLGKNDFIREEELKLPAGMNFLFNSLMKNLSKQFSDNKSENLKRGMNINISVSRGIFPEIKINSPSVKKKQIKEKKFPDAFSSRKMENFSKLQKEEPCINVRRFSDKIIYEINLPEVKSLDDISILKLENSIEIKAISKSKAYKKIIPLNLPVTDYTFEKGKLVLELAVVG